MNIFAQATKLPLIAHSIRLVCYLFCLSWNSTSDCIEEMEDLQRRKGVMNNSQNNHHQQKRHGPKMLIALSVFAFAMVWTDMFSPKSPVESSMIDVVDWSKSNRDDLAQPRKTESVRRREKQMSSTVRGNAAVGGARHQRKVKPSSKIYDGSEETPDKIIRIALDSHVETEEESTDTEIETETETEIENQDEKEASVDTNADDNTDKTEPEEVKTSFHKPKKTRTKKKTKKRPDSPNQRSAKPAPVTAADTTEERVIKSEPATVIKIVDTPPPVTAPPVTARPETVVPATPLPTFAPPTVQEVAIATAEQQKGNTPKEVSPDQDDGKKRISLEDFEQVTKKSTVNVNERHAAAARRVQLRDNMDPQRDLPVHPDAKVEREEENCSDKEEIHIVWSYSSSLAEPSFVMDFTNRRKRIYCGNSECMVLARLPCVAVERLVLTDFFQSTPFAEWIQHHALHKLLTGNMFEEILQVMVQLVVAYRTGALVTQPGTIVPTEEETQQKPTWIGTKLTCGDGAVGDVGGLLALKAEQKSPLIRGLMRTFVQTQGTDWKSVLKTADCKHFLQVDVVSPMVARRHQSYAALADKTLAFSLLHLPRVDRIIKSIHEEMDTPTLTVVSGEHVFDKVSDNLRPLFFGIQWDNETTFDTEFMSQQWPIGVDTKQTQLHLEGQRIDSFVSHDLSRMMPCSQTSKAAFESLQNSPEDESLGSLAVQVLKELTEPCEATKTGRRLTNMLNESEIPGWDLSKNQHTETEEGILNRLNVLAYCQPAVLDASIKFGLSGSEWKFLFDEHYAPCPEPETDPSIPRVAMVVDLNLMRQEVVFATFVNSLAINHKTPLVMYILTTNLDTAQRCLVRYLVGQPLHKDSRIHIIAVDHDLHQFAEHYTGLTHISLATQSRLLLPQLLPCVPKVLWLDADTIVMRPLTELWSTIIPTTPCGIAGRPSFSNYVYWQVKGTPAFVENVRKVYTIKGESAKGFNAGVVILDLANLRRNKLYNQTVHDAAIKYGNDDQVALNLACNGSFTELPQVWNMFHYSGSVEDSRDPAFNNPLSEWGIIHWTSSNKPWAKKTRGFKDSKAQLVWSLYKRKFSESIACAPGENCIMSDANNKALRRIVATQTSFPTASPTSPTPTTKAPKEVDTGSCMYLPYGGELVTVWAYNSAPLYSENSFPNYHVVWKRVICRVEACVKMIESLNVPCLRVSRWETRDLVAGTVMESWFEKNADVALEGQIQVISQLVYLYKFGGIVTKAGVRLPSPLPTTWIGSKELKDGANLDTEGKKCVKEVVPEAAFVSPVGIGAMGAPVESEFILSVLESFIRMYKRESQRKIDWPSFFQKIDCSRWKLIGLT